MDNILHKQIDQAVGRYELSIKKKAREEQRAPRLITISRQIGAGGRDIAELLCKKLGCVVWGREVLDVLASQAGGDYHARMFKALDESSQGAIDEIVDEFFGRVGRHTYHYLLPKAILTIAHSDAVFLGRGANLLLPQAFHVRITASLENRIRNVRDREKISDKAAEARIHDIDHQREKFLKEFCRTIQAKFCTGDFDLILNTDRISFSDAADIILQAYKLFVKTGAPEQEWRAAV